MKPRLENVAVPFNTQRMLLQQRHASRSLLSKNPGSFLNTHESIIIRVRRLVNKGYRNNVERYKARKVCSMRFGLGGRLARVTSQTQVDLLLELLRSEAVVSAIDGDVNIEGVWLGFVTHELQWKGKTLLIRLLKITNMIQ